MPPKYKTLDEALGLYEDLGEAVELNLIIMKMIVENKKVGMYDVVKIVEVDKQWEKLYKENERMLDTLEALRKMLNGEVVAP